MSLDTVCVCELCKWLVCLLCNFCIFNNCSLSFKINNMCQIIVYCDVVNIQPRFNFSDEIITEVLSWILNQGTARTGVFFFILVQATVRQTWVKSDSPSATPTILPKPQPCSGPYPARFYPLLPNPNRLPGASEGLGQGNTAHTQLMWSSGKQTVFPQKSMLRAQLILPDRDPPTPTPTLFAEDQFNISKE